MFTGAPLFKPANQKGARLGKSQNRTKDGDRTASTLTLEMSGKGATLIRLGISLPKLIS